MSYPAASCFQRLAAAQLAAIALLLIICLIHAAHELPVSLELLCSICLLWAAFAGWSWELQQAPLRRGARPDTAEEESGRRRGGHGGPLARAAHELSTPVSTMLLVVGELRRGPDTLPHDWKESVDTLWAQLQTCRGALNTLARPEAAERDDLDLDAAVPVSLKKNGERR